MSNFNAKDHKDDH